MSLLLLAHLASHIKHIHCIKTNLFYVLLQKVEVIGEDEEEDDDDDDGELVASDLEQMQNLLEFKVRTKQIVAQYTMFLRCK